MAASALIGKDSQTGQPMTIGDIERRSGLYILGKPGMGKSSLSQVMMIQDIDNNHSIFFLDPHGDGIADFINLAWEDSDESEFSACLETAPALLFNPENDTHSFGINLLQCRDTSNLKEIVDAYTRAFNVFYKLWEQDWWSRPWLQLILQYTLYVFVENPEYTLAEVPLFLTNPLFRDHLVSNVKHNTTAVDFWRYEFGAKREREQQEQVQAALTRVSTLLGHPYIKHIVGQRTTIDFSAMLDKPSVVFVHLSANLAEDIKRFIGTILISELVHAVRNRPEDKRGQYCVFIDEFQNFTASDDFTTLITEGRKFGVATTIIHQERSGQFAGNPKLAGATAAAANKVLFQLTVADAKELAPEFARETTTTETRLEPELIITKQPVWDLLTRGHANPRVQELAGWYLGRLQRQIRDCKELMDEVRLERLDLQDQAAITRDEAALIGISGKRGGLIASQDGGRGIPFSAQGLDEMQAAFEEGLNIHTLSWQQAFAIKEYYKMFLDYRQRIERCDRFLTAIMENRLSPSPGDENYSQFFIDVLGGFNTENKYIKVFWLYLQLRFGNPQIKRSIPAILALKYWPKDLGDSYQESEIIFENGLPATRGQKQYFFTQNKEVEAPPIVLSDLRPGILTASEIETIQKICYDEIVESVRQKQSLPRLFGLIDDLIEFCNLLTKPENHMKIPSGQYVEKQVHVRPVHDMTDEMAQELANLPRFTAYAKVIQEQDGQQSVVKKKIQTYALPSLPDRPPGSIQKLMASWEKSVIHKGYTKERSAIEEEIKKRQAKWRDTGEVPPPPTHTGGDNSPELTSGRAERKSEPPPPTHIIPEKTPEEKSSSIEEKAIKYGVWLG